jgi:SAM-dependent methyltransferase
MDLPSITHAAIRIDLGCGSAKREGFIGLDSARMPGVDHVIDLTKDTFPFADDSVDEVFSSHFLEHIGYSEHLLREIGRVCKDGARLEFWTPYAFSSDAFLFGHKTYLTKQQWMHFCYLYPKQWTAVLRGRWVLTDIVYVVLPETEDEMRSRGFSMDFAIRYFKSVVVEYGVFIEYRKDSNTPVIEPRRFYSHSRYGKRFELTRVDVQHRFSTLRRLVPDRLKKYLRQFLRK